MTSEGIAMRRRPVMQINLHRPDGVTSIVIVFHLGGTIFFVPAMYRPGSTATVTFCAKGVSSLPTFRERVHLRDAAIPVAKP